MPTYKKCAPALCLPRNQSGLVGINRNSPCDGYFGCDDEIFETDGKAALLSGRKGSKRQHFHYLPWIKRKSPPVLSFFKRMASIRKNTSKKKESKLGNHYHTLPEPRTKSFYLGYKCLPFDSHGIASLKRNYCCDGYFGCPTNED